MDYTLQNRFVALSQTKTLEHVNMMIKCAYKDVKHQLMNDEFVLHVYVLGFFFSAENNNMTELNISWNQFRVPGAKCLARGLKVNIYTCSIQFI